MSSTTSSRIRALSALAVLGLAGAALAGCASTPQDSNTISVAFNGGEGVPAAAALFEEANPGTKVELKNVTDPDGQIIGTQLAGGNASDVIVIQPGSGGIISAQVAGDRGQLTDLSDEPWADTVPESAKRVLVTSEGELVAVPMTFSSIGGVYNETAIESVGMTIPTTWPEVLQFCADAKANGKVAYGLGLSDAWTTQLIPYALVATLVYAEDPDFIQKQDDGTATFSDSGWKTAMDKYEEMGTEGCFNESPAGTPYATVQNAVASGSTLATVTVAAETASIQALAPEGTAIQYAAFPATDNADDTYLAANVGPALAVTAKAKNVELAKKFVAFLAEPETQIAFANAYGDTAAMPGDLKQDTQVSDLALSYINSQKISGWPDNQWPTGTSLKDDMYSGIQGMFSGQATPESTLEAMDTAFEAAQDK
ncbi:Multiple sugar-binding protein [Microbacterium sp. Bi98]|uniref:ABC transporter substrate-binding protein n=1 Tax=Microbacterium sp. Bi98 TaxID=2821116 RepID=UPI001E1799FB|nr:extracellular solute-binding protein [Microbacterium sp. Bi98]CAH0123815.1 Multiple sugar-binding protein [Microbacterium sp. Bi98]